jgi:hypothetical protein
LVNEKDNEKINWKIMPMIDHQGIYWCPICLGKGWTNNKYSKPIACISCGEKGMLKQCPMCDNLMQMEENKCIACLLKYTLDLTEDPDLKEW